MNSAEGFGQIRVIREIRGPNLKGLSTESVDRMSLRAISHVVVMISPEGMRKCAKAIEAQGFAPNQAEVLASLLGDIIEEDENGLWIVRDEQGIEVARIQPLC